jgi:hypothetical protein
VNYIERTIALKAGLSQVAPGDRVPFEPDYLYLSGRSAQAVLLQMSEARSKEVHGAFRTNLILGADFGQIPVWARHLEESSLHIITEEELAWRAKGSQSLLVAGADFRVGAAGAMGSIPILLSPAALIQCLLTGKTEMTIPDTIYIELHAGYSQTFNTAGLAGYIEDYFKDSLIGCGVIIGGEAIRGIEEADKLKISKCLYDMGVSIAVYSPSGAMGQVENAVKIQQHALEKMK